MVYYRIQKMKILNKLLKSVKKRDTVLKWIYKTKIVKNVFRL